MQKDGHDFESRGMNLVKMEDPSILPKLKWSKDGGLTARLRMDGLSGFHAVTATHDGKTYYAILDSRGSLISLCEDENRHDLHRAMIKRKFSRFI